MNDKILNKRWAEVDKLLSAFYTKNNKINKRFKNNIQMILNVASFIKYEDLYNYADKHNVEILKSKIEELKEEYVVSGYINYKLGLYLNKKKIKNNELLVALFMIEYYKQNHDRKPLEDELFEEISNLVYVEAQKETAEVLKKKKPRLLTVPEAFLLELIGMSAFNEMPWEDYKEGNIIYNSNQLFKTTAVNIQAGKELNVNSDSFKKLFESQDRNYLAKKKNIPDTDGYFDEYYGPLDSVVCYIANQSALAGMKKQGCEKVQFVATVDEKTTDMCSSLNGQVFNIYEWNTYDRYSAIDKKNIIYRTKGLKIGENLPPINNHIHHCRSTIYPVR